MVKIVLLAIVGFYLICRAVRAEAINEELDAASGHSNYQGPEYDHDHDDGINYIEAAAGKHLLEKESFANPSMEAAYCALQAWKLCIKGDPKKVTTTWEGKDVCKYKGVFCAAPPDKSCDKVVAGIDLNHFDLEGTLPQELGFLNYLALFHINSNRFSGTLPANISSWNLLFELDISNNQFSGPFPDIVLSLPSLAYLDIRFNQFHGPLPPSLFQKRLDALFINHNNFNQLIPPTFCDSTASVIVLADNRFVGGIPNSINKMANTLREIIFLGNAFQGCVPSQFGYLLQLTVLDLSFNNLSGILPPSIAHMASLQQLDVAHNLLTGDIPADICSLPGLQNLSASFNFFTGESPNCLQAPAGDILNDRNNCIAWRPSQRPAKECDAFFAVEQACPAPRPPSPKCDPVPISSNHVLPPPGSR